MRLSDNVRVYPAIFSYADDGISVHFPDLPGCLTCGQTEAEALFMAKDALRCYLAILQDAEEPIPEPTPMYQLGETDERERIMLVCIGDEQPVRHGRYDEAGDCTVCGYPMPVEDRLDYIAPHKIKYCYNCGAMMMDGGAK